MPNIEEIDPDLIAIQDAVEKFTVSLAWLYAQSGEPGEGKPLTRVKVAGDRRTFLRQSQIRLLMRPSDQANQPSAGA